MDITMCPERGCDGPAEVIDRRVLESTDGPTEHVWLVCLFGHRLLLPVEMLPTAA